MATILENVELSIPKTQASIKPVIVCLGEIVQMTFSGSPRIEVSFRFNTQAELVDELVE